jgi:glycine dehydrogenase subunit 1
VVVDALLSRGEFFTAHTPYQAEIAQGTLQAMFVFQTLMAQLTGQEVSNASLYDGSTATTEAALMALRVTRRHCAVLARTLHPEYRQIVRTYVHHQDVELVEVPYGLSFNEFVVKVPGDAESLLEDSRGERSSSACIWENLILSS